jgi:8-oxo-dGTP pyrophosphatase MutT (NUDIX family)
MEYVCVYADGADEQHVLVIHKNRPDWQKGKINLPGGHMEKGETPEVAAIRELKEETGLAPQGEASVMGKITGTWGTVYCVRVPVFFVEPKPREGETEAVEWMAWRDLANNPLMLPNLRVVAPMIRCGVKNWVIYDEGPSWNDGTHLFTAEVMSWKREDGN